MAYFSIKDRLRIQYQDSNHSQELRYYANYICNGNIKDIFNGLRYQKPLFSNFF